MSDNLIHSDLSVLDGGEATSHLIATLAQHSIAPTKLNDGDLYAVKTQDGGVELLPTPGFVQATADALADGPRRIERRITVRDAESLLDYLGHNTLGETDEVQATYLHTQGELEVWADIDKRTIKAVLDGGSGWRQHTAILELRHSAEWNEWNSIDGKLIGQVEFAQFVEDHLSSIGAPDGAKLLEICQSLEATTKVAFKSSELLANGQRKFKYDETTEAKAGQKGDMVIPGDLTLVLRPFQGSDAVPMLARFRYRINGDNLLIGVKLVEPTRALEDAFDGIVAIVQNQVPVRINHGIC